MTIRSREPSSGGGPPSGPPQRPERDGRRIFAVLGMLPEPGGYSIAKFSRSARPYQEWALDLTQEGAERFYKTFYFEYGHASIADLAHLTVVLEGISMVAAEELWDEPLVDGQASSTRYQDFRQRGVVLPPEIRGTLWEGRYLSLCEGLIEFYTEAHGRVTRFLMERYAAERPLEMGEEKYERTLRARAFDVVRYALPMGIRTGLGQILSARTLERMLVRLLSHPLREIREIGQELKEAVTRRPAFHPTAERLKPLLEELKGLCAGGGSGAGAGEARASEILRQMKKLQGWESPAAPTLVRYAEPSPYILYMKDALSELAREYAPRLPEPDGGRGVGLAPPQAPLTEAVCTLLYRALPHSYEQILGLVEALPEGEKRDILDRVYRGRGEHDPPPRELRTGYALIFDVCVDCGAWRDFHRHRRLVQVHKRFDASYGYDVPSALEEAGLSEPYRALMDRAGELSARLDAAYPGIGVGQYALPFAYRRRSLFKMDVEELQYIVELRTRPENHFSVREIAYQMYERFRERCPAWAKHLRVVPPDQEEFFRR